MDDNKNILFDRNNFKFVKNEVNNYSLIFDINNDNIDLFKIVDFQLIKLIYDLNKDIYENVQIEYINDNEIILFSLLKHLFEDIGLSQKFSHLHIKKIENDKYVEFISTPINTKPKYTVPLDSEQINIYSLSCICNILNNNSLNFVCNIKLNNSANILPFVEKIIGLVLFKIFSRVKTFLENVKIY